MLIAKLTKKKLIFRFEAGTSRGVLTEKDSFFIEIYDTPQQIGYGEISPLRALSVDDLPNLETILNQITADFSAQNFIHFADAWEYICLKTKHLPALRFGFETALKDLQNGGKKCIETNDFFTGKRQIAINGLVWMGKKEFMQAQIEEKLKAGFSCIKMKIGAISWQDELELLKNIRQRYGVEQITLRVDANGAFAVEQAKKVLDELHTLGVHSIEQPIKAGNIEAMKNLCAQSPTPIALDEELIGIKTDDEKRELLQYIRPQFIILKPTLLGGLAESAAWIKTAVDCSIGWWLTSALEANIGLNAICQFAANYDLSMPQGLGTGQLYENNIDSPLSIKEGHIFYDIAKYWETT